MRIRYKRAKFGSILWGTLTLTEDPWLPIWMDNIDLPDREPCFGDER